MRRLLALSLLISSLACVCAAGLAAPAALAAGSASTTAANSLTGSGSNFSLQNGGAATTPAVQTVAPSTSTSSSGGGLSGNDGIIIAIVAALILGGIAFYIWNDARGHAARVGHGEEDALFGQRAHAGSKAPRKQRKLKPAERKRRKRGRAR
jgi:hypothetical protein